MIDPSSAALPIGAAVSNPLPCSVPDHTPLHGRTVTLQAFDADLHADGLFAVSHGSPELERLWTYLPAGPYENPTVLGDWYRSLGAGGDPLFYTVLDTASETPIGIVSFLSIEPAHGTIEIGHIWYASEWQGTSANTEACSLLLTEAFDRLGYRRMEWKCDALNARSRAAAQRLGFQFEGVFRQHRVIRGRNRDTAWYSIVDSEWPVIRDGMRRWLDWDDTTGRPRPSLGSLTARDTR